MGFDIGVRLGLRLGPPGYAECPVELGANPMQLLLPLNPFFVLMQTVRGPLLDGGAPPLIWACAVLYTAPVSALAFAFFVRFRVRIPFWV